MCWIFAYNGTQNCIPLLVDGLKTLEYRGYDSAGVVGVNDQGEVFVQKAIGKVSNLATKVEHNINHLKVYTTGIAHTRWATHGTVTELNTHPHTSSKERFYVVHNGIIENFKELKKKLSDTYEFYSDTDTEVIAKLIEEHYDTDLKTTLEKVSWLLTGAYSLAVIDIEDPDTIVGIKLGSPLVVWENSEGVFISSDVNALASVAESYVTLEDHEMVVIQDKKFQIYMAGNSIERKTQEMDVKYDVDELGAFSSYTEKEIHDVPTVLENVFNGRINFTDKAVHNETLEELWEHDIQRIEIISSGSSYYAWMIGSYLMKDLAGIPVQVTISSEFLADVFLPDQKTLYVFLSQSWETADVRESLKIVKAKWCLTFGIVNVVGSSIARLTDMWLYSHAGIEIGVASTKNVIAQVAVLLMMALSLGAKRWLQHSESRWLIEELSTLGDKIQQILIDAPKIREIAKKYTQYSSMFVLGRNIFYPVSGEASLKCKELSYIHTESYSTGELKHGPLALVWPDFPCVVFNPEWKFYTKTVSNIKEIRAREWTVLGFVTKWEELADLYDDVVEIPKTSEVLSVFTSLVASYLFALFLAQELERDVDKPKNLAKSVTVE